MDGTELSDGSPGGASTGFATVVESAAEDLSGEPPVEGFTVVASAGLSEVSVPGSGSMPPTPPVPGPKFFVSAKGNSGSKPPQIEDGWTSERIREEVMMWIGETSVDSSAWATAFARAQTDETRRTQYMRWVTQHMVLAREQALEDLTTLGGLDHLLKHFEGQRPPVAFLKVKLVNKFHALGRFQNETMDRFLARVDIMLSEMVSVGVNFMANHEDYLTAWLLNAAKLDDATFRSMISVAGADMKWDPVVVELRRVYQRESLKEAKQGELDPEVVSTPDPESGSLPGAGSQLAALLEAQSKQTEEMMEAMLARNGLKKRPTNKATAKLKAAKLERLKKIRCYNCWEFGHYKPDCKNPTREKPADAIGPNAKVATLFGQPESSDEFVDATDCVPEQMRLDTYAVGTSVEECVWDNFSCR